MNVLISACLLGTPCRYDGKSKQVSGIEQLMRECHLIPVCPEIFGGLATPRTPAERREGLVVTKDGRDVTAEYEWGAMEVLRLARMFDCEAAVLKEKSPSCGKGKIYDGSFTGTLTKGNGVCAQLLEKNGISVLGESEISAFIAKMRKTKKD